MRRGGGLIRRGGGDIGKEDEGGGEGI